MGTNEYCVQNTVKYDSWSHAVKKLNTWRIVKKITE